MEEKNRKAEVNQAKVFNGTQRLIVDFNVSFFRQNYIFIIRFCFVAFSDNLEISTIYDRKMRIITFKTLF